MLFLFNLYLPHDDFMTELKDLHLVGKYKNGDNKALGVLITRHRDRLMKLICSLIRNKGDAEYILQNAMVIIIEGFNNDAHLNIESPDIKRWMSTIVYRETMQYHKKNKCNGVIEYVENIGDSYTQDFVNDENRDILVNRVLTDDRLTDTERYILEKRYNNFKFKVIAKDLNMNVEAVMAKYYKVTDKIRTKW